MFSPLFLKNSWLFQDYKIQMHWNRTRAWVQTSSGRGSVRPVAGADCQSGQRRWHRRRPSGCRVRTSRRTLLAQPGTLPNRHNLAIFRHAREVTQTQTQMDTHTHTQVLTCMRETSVRIHLLCDSIFLEMIFFYPLLNYLNFLQQTIKEIILKSSFLKLMRVLRV